MGMFDSIIIKRKLPLNDELKNLNLKWDEIIFQTKNLSNCLSTYYIEKNGLLKEEIVEGNWTPIPENERKSPWDISNFNETKRYKKKIDYHGIINFYEYLDIDDLTGAWVEFEAYFIYGKLDKFVLKEFKKEKNRKIDNEEWFKEQQEKEKKLPAKIKKFLNRIGWKKFWLFIDKNILNKIINFLNNLKHFIYREIL
jgi:hypothetical protein